MRSEACAADFYKALDLAAERLERRFRQAADRRRIHRGRHAPPEVADLAIDESALLGAIGSPEAAADDTQDGPGDRPREGASRGADDRRRRAVRDGTRGHDFYLFRDAESGRASVVYRRHAYDYGLIRLAD